MTVALLSLLGTLALTSCADTGTSAQVYEADAVVLENTLHGPELCLGLIQQSNPPQCGEVPVTNWDWTSVDGEETLGGTTMGNYHVTGTYDGTNFTLTETPRLAVSEPTSPSDLQTPCQEPSEAQPRRDGRQCLTQVERSRAELLAITSEVTTEVAEELGLFVLSAEDDEVHNRVLLTAVLVTPDQQRSLDERYGPGVVVAESRLRPIG